MIIVLIAAPIGAAIGFAFHPVVNYAVYQSMGIQAPLVAFSMESIMFCMISLVMVGVWLIIVDSGFVYRMDSLSAMFKARKNMNPIENQKSKYMKLLYVIVYGYVLYFLCSLNFHYISFVFMIYVSVGVWFGPANMFRYTLPDAIQWLKDRFYSADRYRNISVGNLKYSIINSNSLVTIILIDVSILFFYLCQFRNDNATFMVVFVSYLVSLLLLCVCIIYKLSSDALSKKQIYQNMMAIGYLTTDIKRIIKQEVGGFFFLIILVCVPLLFLIGVKFLLIDTIDITFMLAMLVSFMIMIAFAGMVMNRIYCNLILKDALANPMHYEE